ncbi:hypothetical protein [Sorangium cellulosum]|nr:hypothetical protein [Sorangium cellulosum]
MSIAFQLPDAWTQQSRAMDGGLETSAAFARRALLSAISASSRDAAQG